MYGEMRVSEYLRYRGSLKELSGAALSKAVDQHWSRPMSRM